MPTSRILHDANAFRSIYYTLPCSLGIVVDPNCLKLCGLIHNNGILRTFNNTLILLAGQTTQVLLLNKSVLAEAELIESLADFMKRLNGEEDALVVVEGMRDARALKNSGFDGEIFMLCHNKNVSKLEEAASNFHKTILLLDNDSEGRKLSERTRKILGSRVNLDTRYQKGLLPASKGKIRHVEELMLYAEKLAHHA